MAPFFLAVTAAEVGLYKALVEGLLPHSISSAWVGCMMSGSDASDSQSIYITVAYADPAYACGYRSVAFPPTITAAELLTSIPHGNGCIVYLADVRGRMIGYTNIAKNARCGECLLECVPKHKHPRSWTDFEYWNRRLFKNNSVRKKKRFLFFLVLIVGNIRLSVAGSIRSFCRAAVAMAVRCIDSECNVRVHWVSTRPSCVELGFIEDGRGRSCVE